MQTEKEFHSLFLLSRKVNKKPLTMRRATGLGIQRHNLPSIYATMPDKTNFPMPHFQVNLTLGATSAGFAGTTAFALSPSELHLMPAMNLFACFLSNRMVKLTNRCSHNVSTVGPSLHSCCKKFLSYL